MLNLIHSKASDPLKLLFMLLSGILLVSFAVFGYMIWNDIKQNQFIELAKQNKVTISQTKTFLTEQALLIHKTLKPTLIENSYNSVEINNKLNYLLATNDEVIAYFLLDTKGKVLIKSGVQIENPPKESQELIEQIKQYNSSQVGYMYNLKRIEFPILPFYVPIWNEHNQLIAIAGILFEVSPKSSLFAGQNLVDGKTIWLLNEQGKVHLVYPTTQGLISSFLGWRLSTDTTNAIQISLRNNPDISLIETKISGEKILASTNQLTKYRLIALNTQPISNLLSTWLNRLKPVGIIFVIFLIIAFFAYRLSVKINQRMADARQQAEGNVYKLSSAIEQSPNSVIITNHNWQIEYANRHFNLESTTEVHSIQDIIGHHLINYIPYSTLQADLNPIKDELKLSGHWFGERKTDYDERWYAFSINTITDETGEITHYVIIVQDINSRKQTEARLYHQANFDQLTGLPNRRRAHKNLATELSDAWKQDAKVAVFYLDIDNFKKVNDSFGHAIGDQLLQLVAERLSKCCKDRAKVYHLSGDEFLVYTSYFNQDDLPILARHILDKVETPVLIEGKQIFISISIGITRYPEDSDNVMGLVRCADIALFESKNMGRNRYSFFNNDLEYRLQRQNNIEIELRQALKRREIKIVYQSKNDIKTGKTIGFEALMRWKHPALGDIEPFEFIKVAEETGIVTELGEFALQQACRDLQYFQTLSSTPLSMAVNISVLQLKNDNIITTISNILEETQISPQQLELEITETLLVENINNLMPCLNKIQSLGCSLSIDDFGTGYSSLSYLTSLPVNTLKIDQSFVAEMTYNENAATVAQTIIAMAHSLNMKVVAEGIELNEQLNMLMQYKCDIGQGFLFSKPIFKNKVTELLNKEQLTD